MVAKTVYQILLQLEGSQQAQSELRELSQASQELGAVLAATGASLTAVLGLGAKVNAETESGLAFLGTVTGQTEAELSAYNDSLTEVIENTQGLANRTDLLKGAYQAASGGIRDTASNLALLEASAKTALVGQAEQADVVQATVAAYKQLGDTLDPTLSEAEKLTAIQERLILVQNEGIITVGELAGAYGQVASGAASVSVSLAELNAAIATVTAAGVPAASAVSGLNQVFAAIARGGATEEGKRLLEEAGVAFDQAAVEAVGLTGILEQFSERGLDSGEALTQILGSTEAVNAVVPLLSNNVSELNRQLALQQGEVSVLDESFNRLANTQEQKIAAAFNKIRELVASIAQGVTAAAEPLLDAINFILDGLNALPQPLKTLLGLNVAVAAGFTTLAGAILFIGGTVGNLIPGLLAVSQAFSSLQAKATAANPAIAATNANLQLLTQSSGASAVALTNTGNAASGAATKIKLAKAALTGIAGIGAAAALAAVAAEWNNVATASKSAEEASQRAVDAIAELRRIQAREAQNDPDNEDNRDEIQKLVDENIQRIKDERSGLAKLLDNIRPEEGRSFDAAIRGLRGEFANEVLAAEELISELESTDVGSLSDEELKAYQAALKETIATIKSLTVTQRSQVGVQNQYLGILEQLETRLNANSGALDTVADSTTDATATTGDLEEEQKSLAETVAETTQALRDQASRETRSTENRLQAGQITEIEALRENLATQRELTRGLVAEERKLAQSSNVTAEERVAARERVTAALEEGAAQEAQIQREIRETQNALFDQGIEQQVARINELQAARVVSEEEAAARIAALRVTQLQDELGRIDQEIQATAEGSLAREQLITQQAQTEAQLQEQIQAQREAFVQGYLNDLQLVSDRVAAVAGVVQDRLSNALDQTSTAQGFLGEIDNLFSEIESRSERFTENLESQRARLQETIETSDDSEAVSQAQADLAALNAEADRFEASQRVQNQLALDLADSFRESGLIVGEITTAEQAREAIAQAQLTLKIREIELQRQQINNEIRLQQLQQETVALEQQALLESGTLGERETQLAETRLQVARQTIGLLEEQRAVENSNLDTRLDILRAQEQINAAVEAEGNARRAANAAGESFDRAASRAVGGDELKTADIAAAVNPVLQEQNRAFEKTGQTISDATQATGEMAIQGFQESLEPVTEATSRTVPAIQESQQAVVGKLDGVQATLSQVVQGNQEIRGSLVTLGDRILGGINGIRNDLGALPGSIGSAVARSIPRPPAAR